MGGTRFEVFFQRVAEATGIDSQQELATLLGVNRSAVTQAKNRDVVPERWLHRLSRDLGLDAHWLTTGVEKRRASFEGFAKVPKVRATLSAGGGSFETGAQIESYYAFEEQWLRRRGEPAQMVLMDVWGNSMEPELREGDTVLIDQSQRRVLAGSIYAVGVEDTVMVKRIEKRPSALVLVSENREYEPIVLMGDELELVRVLGKPVWLCREYR